MKQKDAIDILKLGHNVFLTGPPGSGKTFLLNEYIAYLRKHHKGVAVTASTGVAATHMDGITIHSWTGIGVKDELSKHDILKLLRKPYLKKSFKDTNVLIIDEISMLHNFQFDMINTVCQSFKNSARPFGGMQIVCSGDFFQLPPVAKKGEAKFVVDSLAWQEMDIKVCYLGEQHRQKDDKLSTLLDYIRGNAHKESRAMLLDRKEQQDSSFVTPIKLYTHNIDVDSINNFYLDKIDETKFVYRMKIQGNEKIAASLGKNCLAPEKLEIKIGAKVMFVKNNFDCGYVNGTLGQVVGFSDINFPIVKTYKGREIIAEPCKWKIEENYIIKAEVEQIPLRLAWAITIHKSQGMNLDAAEIDLFPG
jgi:ATP-dependent exoDNAse (exonuclease V) alpha subunit